MAVGTEIMTEKRVNKNVKIRKQYCTQIDEEDD